MSDPEERGLRVEVCVESAVGARLAARAGADRIELCAALELGGLTPSAGTIADCVDLLPTHVLIRPRAGDFAYDAYEIRLMAKDIEHAIDAGAAGVVVGALTRDRIVDIDAMHRLLGAAGQSAVTFHRAFDSTADPLRAFDDLLELPVDRVLTSGAAATAAQGISLLAELVRRADGDLEVMAGGGLRPDGMAEVVRLTGVPAVHFSASVTVAHDLSMGMPDAPARRVTDAALLQRMMEALRDL